jgi:hypothetical protein
MPDQPTSRTPADDRDAIVRQVYAYCRAMDRMDVELGYAVWHEGGEADYGPSIFQGTGRGFVDYVTKGHATLTAHSHQVTNVLLTLEGDRATSESYVTAALRSETEQGLMQTTVRGRYLDRWSFRHGRWAIDKRVYVHDFDDVRAVTPSGLPSSARRDRSDPSYAILDL